jgi:hypothetical protein
VAPFSKGAGAKRLRVFEPNKYICPLLFAAGFFLDVLARLFYIQKQFIDAINKTHSNVLK